MTANNLKQQLRKLLISLFILFVFISRGFAQANIITVDTLTSSPSKPYPFDTAFSVKFTPPKNTKISSVDIFRLKRNGCMRPVFPRCFGCLVKDIFKSGLPPGQHRSFKRFLYNVFKGQGVSGYRIPQGDIKPDSVGNLYIRFPQLQPNRNYLVIISSIASFRLADSILIALHNNRDTATAHNFLTRVYLQSKKMQPLGDPSRCSKCKVEPFFINGNFGEFLTYYDTAHISRFQDSLDVKATAMTFQRATPPLLRNVDSAGLYAIDDSIVSSFISYSQECLQCHDTIWQYKWFIKNNVDIPLLLTNLNKINDTLLCKGYATPDSFYYYMPGDSSYKKKAGNLLYTFNCIANLQQLTDYYVAKYHLGVMQMAVFRQSLARAHTVLLSNYQAMNARSVNYARLITDSSDARKNIQNSIANYKGFNQPFSSLNTNTYSFDFDTRSGFVLKADFGFLYYGNPQKNSALQGFSPYLGFHVNFRPLNTNVRYYKINHKGIQGHLSFVSGVLITSLKETGKREGLVGDASIFTGFGWAFSHAVRLTAGTVFYKKLDNNPLIDHKTTAVTAFAGLSFDLRLKEAYSSVKKFFEP